MSRRLNRTLAALLLTAFLAAAALAQGPDGKLLEQKTFDAWDYDKLAPWQKEIYSRATFDALRDSKEVELLKIRYASDGLSVAGFIARPKKRQGLLPFIVFSRGGLEDGLLGMSNFHFVQEMLRYASEGFVVVASQYRGYEGAGGRDEVGGADLADVFNIIKMARSLDYVDPERLFMWGYSRGGLMTLQAIRDGAKPRAVVLVGAPTDYGARLPLAEPFYRQTFPDYDRRKDEHLRNRTPLNWVEKIDAPVLILHGGEDNLPPAQSLNLALRMEQHGKLYELVVYAGDNHPIIANREDRVRRAVDWFKNPRKMSAAFAIRGTVGAEGAAAGVRRYREFQKTQADRYQFDEADLNRLGYLLLAAGRAKDAIEIFKLNVEQYPQGFNTYDSLAEAYAAAGERELAIKNYRKSLELNPQNTNAVERLKELERK